MRAAAGYPRAPLFHTGLERRVALPLLWSPNGPNSFPLRCQLWAPSPLDLDALAQTHSPYPVGAQSPPGIFVGSCVGAEVANII